MNESIPFAFCVRLSKGQFHIVEKSALTGGVIRTLTPPDVCGDSPRVLLDW
jgi:hypothetical protein